MIQQKTDQRQLPCDFVFLTDINTSFVESVRYAVSDNFLGRPVVGYTIDRIICTKTAAQALSQVQFDLQNDGYTLVVYDGYRPKRAVDEFKRWSLDKSDQCAKELYYPTIDKKDVIKLGYIAERSTHSRGSTFDVSIMKRDHSLKPVTVSTRTLLNGDPIPFLDDHTVDMGSSFDLFHEASHHDSPLVDANQTAARNYLRDLMHKHGFKGIKTEWWHYTLNDEPYPDTYFDFVF